MKLVDWNYSWGFLFQKSSWQHFLSPVYNRVVLALTAWDSVTLQPCSRRFGALKLWNWRFVQYSNIWKNFYKNHSGQVHRWPYHISVPFSVLLYFLSIKSVLILEIGCCLVKLFTMAWSYFVYLALKVRQRHRISVSNLLCRNKSGRISPTTLIWIVSETEFTAMNYL